MAECDSRAVMVRPQRREMTMNEMKDFAKWAVASRKFKNIRNPVQAMILMQYGRELGLGPATALQSVYEVNGVPALKGQTIAARIKSVAWQGTNKPRYDYRLLKRTATVCEIEFFERNDEGRLESRGVISYSMEDARLAGDLRNDQYKKRPKDMLFWRCLTVGARIFCPDCLGGLAPYTPEELGAQVNEEGEPVQVEDADFEVKEPAADAPFDEAENGIGEAEFAALQADANAKNLHLPDVIAGLGGDPNDVRGMTRGQYEAAAKFIENK